MPSQFSPQSTVGSIVAEHPGTARVLERLGIDYCCGGKRPLADACAKRGLDAAGVVRELEDACRTSAGERSWLGASMSALAGHIESTHHEYLRHELPRLQALLAKVASVHGERHPEMVEASRLFDVFAAELTQHMADEEDVLFPALRAVEKRTAASASGITPRIDQMLREHDDAGAALAKLRALTSDYTPPEGACATFRVALASLAQLEQDMHQHVHKENNILFPAALRRLGGC